MRRSRILFGLLVGAIAAGGMVGLAAAPAAATPPAPPLNFQLPFECGQKWKLQTYLGHNPDDKKIDMFRQDGTTNGSNVVAAADGTVSRVWFDTGAGNAVEINHGNNWFTVYFHMQNSSIVVSPGQAVYSGQKLGLVGSTGSSSAPHLHFEMRYSTGSTSNNSNMINPIINGEEYHLSPNGPFPIRYSHNCGEMPGVTSTSSRMFAFVRGTDRSIFINTYNGSSWSGWRGTGSGLLTSSPTAVAWTDRNGSPRIDVFANGAEDLNGISQVYWQTSWDGGATFGPWTAIGGNLTTAPAVTAKEGTLWLFGRGTNGTLYSRTLVPHWLPNFGEDEYLWNAWEQRTTDRMSSAPSAASYRNDQVQAWYTRSDLHPYQVFWSDTTQTWAGPMQPGGAVGNIIGAMGLMQWSDRFEVYGRGTDQRTYYKWFSDAAGWSNWAQLSQVSAIKSGVASTIFGGHSQLFARAANGNVLWSPPSYAPWVNLGGVAI